MKIYHRFKPCWWLWGCLSVPVIAYLLFRLHENKAGDVHSDLSFMLYAVRHPEQYGWRYCRERLFWDVLAPLVLGWVVQCLGVVAWDSWRHRRSRAQPAS